MPAIIGSWIISAYATKYKELKYPLVICFTLFLVSSIFYATVSPTENHAQMGINVLTGFGQAGPLTLITPIIQYSSPHALIATASGLAAVARAVGGAFGSAVLDAIVNGHLDSTLDLAVGSAATKAGLPASSVPALMAAFASGTGFGSVPGINSTILEAASDASHWAYAHAYRLAWSSVIPFVALAIIGILCLKDVKEMMTEHVEASVEPGAAQREASHEVNHEL
ncbi:uncharacterized protein PFLUO_LOCUS8561 [Penicillium psychrofluorescens]|uniref:uncharacterized protein n=1 Tax=Penicillium psychrofluorescens TaxID=3158075 RepID=UPI003CCCD2EE